MNFPGYITLDESRRRETSIRLAEQQVIIRANNQLELESLDELIEALPLLNCYAEDQAIAIEFVGKKRPIVVGGWVIGQYYYDSLQTEPEPAYLAIVVVTENGVIASGVSSLRNGLNIVSVTRRANDHRTIHKLRRIIRRHQSRSNLFLQSSSIQSVLINTTLVKDKLGDYLYKKTLVRRDDR